MKIGIMTFWWSQDNYGQLLQCYALQKYLKDIGHEVFLIRYNYNSDLKKHINYLRWFKIFNPYFVIRFLCKLNSAHSCSTNDEPDREFEAFRKTYLFQSDMQYKKFDDLYNFPPAADMYISGSDQVWNYKYLDTPHSIPYRAYFLDFGNKNIKRVSYAASWGVTQIPRKVKKVVKPLLAKFDYISVREQNGIDLCRQCGRNDAEWVCDPTLLLQAEVYRKIYEENKIRKIVKPFILLYMLNNTFDFEIQKIYEFAENKNLEIVYVTGNGMLDNRKKYYATIPEWIWLVDNAKYVITNSFHCGVFCTIFHKQFGIIPLSGKQTEMNERFESLFKLRGTGNRFIYENDFSILEKEYIVKEIDYSKKYLKVLSEGDIF